MISYKKYRGEVEDVRCKANIIRPISIKVCKNNCLHWDWKNKRCSLGYSPKDQ